MTFAINRLLGELDLMKADGLVPCACGEMLAGSVEWSAGPRITHTDLSVRVHDPRWCGTGDEPGYEAITAGRAA